MKPLAYLAAALLPATLTTASETVDLTANGKALHAIVIAGQASERTQAAAQTLADYLGRISQSSFEITTGDGKAGIAVGKADDFPALDLASRFDAADSQRSEEYLLRSHTGGLYLVGATDLAVEHAAWDLLHRLGHRQFFPGERWEIVPAERNLGISVDDFESPAYHSRRIWYGYGPWDYNAEPYDDWCRKNRAVQGVALSTGHSYGRFLSATREEFDRHPEYWPLLDGERKPVINPKPCLGNPEVRALFVNYALEKFAEDPDLKTISMDPSDGGGWCECEKCAELGSVTDQAVTAANEVAAAVNAKFPGSLVGMYAYAYHSPPPNVRVHPKVVISVATSFIRGGLTLDEILSGWSAQGAHLGIREYYSVNVWDRDQPGRARGSNLEYLGRTIPGFHAVGARFLSAESSDNWGPNGLGYYLAARMLWDLGEAGNLDALTEDFLTRAFRSASEPMRDFYAQLDGSRPHLVADDQVGRMFRALNQARSLADTSAIRARIDDLTLYAHYVSLFRRYSLAKGAERQAAFKELIRHAYRMRKTMLVHTKAIYRDLVRRDKAVNIPPGAEYNDPEPVNPWKSSEGFKESEIAAFLEKGIAAHQLVELDFDPVVFGADLVPAAGPLNFPADSPPGDFGAGRREQIFFTSIERAPSTIELRITGGLIAHYRDRGNVRVDCFKIGGASQTGERENAVAADRSVPPDGAERTVKLSVKEPGLYKIVVADGGDKTLVQWPDEQPMTLHSSQDSPMSDNYGRWTACFYVPKDTAVIGLFGGGRGEVRDSGGHPRFKLDGRRPNFYSIPVPKGEDGKIWRIHNAGGAVRLLTVPPYFATTPQGLLLPREVVENDANP